MTTVPIRPMLAVTADYLAAWPAEGFWVQPKFDGLRCIVDPDRGPCLRSGEPIPNPFVREALQDPAVLGLDGELCAPGGLEAAQRAFTGASPPPEGWRFHAFDDLAAYSSPFETRLARLRRRRLPPWATASPARRMLAPEDAAGAFAQVLADLRETEPATTVDGVVLRHPGRPYREGRASAARCEAIKVKPCDEAEARLADVRARDDAGDTLGAVQVHFGGRPLWAPAAMPRAQARDLWAERDQLEGQAVTLRWWGLTASGLPRHAIAVAVRRDLAPAKRLTFSSTFAFARVM